LTDYLVWIAAGVATLALVAVLRIR